MLRHNSMKPMKIIHTSILLPVLLGGCSLPGNRHESNTAEQFVDTQININLQLIQSAQEELRNASITVQTSRQKSTRAPTLAAAPARTKNDMTPTPLRGLPHIKSIGSPEPFSVISIQVRNAEIEPVLYKIVPNGWYVVVPSDIRTKLSKKVTVDTNDQWPYVLNKLLGQHNLVAIIDWQQRQVSVATNSYAVGTENLRNPFSDYKDKAKAPDGMGKSIVTASPTSTSTSTSAKTPTTLKPVVTETVIKKTVKPVVEPKIWRIEAGATLKDGLFSWAATEKCATPGISTWTVAWPANVVNYRVDAPLQFKGDFRHALNGLFTLYGAAKVPLYAGIISNQCVVMVDDKEVR